MSPLPEPVSPMDDCDAAASPADNGEGNATPPKPPLLQRIRVALSKISLYNLSATQGVTCPYTLLEQQLLVLLLTSPLHSAFRSNLAGALDVLCASLDEAIRQLASKDLIQVHATNHPSRDALLTLQPAGALAAQALIEWPHVLESVLDSLSPSTLEELYVHLLRTILLLQERRQIPTSSMCFTCRHFRPRQYPENPDTPHHCAFVDAPFGGRDLQIDCPDHSHSDCLPNCQIR